MLPQGRDERPLRAVGSTSRSAARPLSSSRTREPRVPYPQTSAKTFASGQSGLRINAVAPGYARSEMVDPERPGAAERLRTPAARHSAMNRLGEAGEVAQAITWLCSGAASFVNGAVLAVDGGDTTRLY
ncbi:MAG: SDR family oxidoreductase [Luteolibacter sp.]